MHSDTFKLGNGITNFIGLLSSDQWSPWRDHGDRFAASLNLQFKASAEGVSRVI